MIFVKIILFCLFVYMGFGSLIDIHDEIKYNNKIGIRTTFKSYKFHIVACFALLGLAIGILMF